MNIFLTIVIVTLALILLFTIDYQLGKIYWRKKLTIHEKKMRYSDFSLYVSGEQLFNDLFNDISKASDNIHILFYIVKNDNSSVHFLNLLINKAHEGVEVVLLLDWLGSRSVSRKLIKELKKAGGSVYFCNRPKLPFLFYSLQVRNHRKIAVIDSKIAYVGGYNIGDEYINLKPRLSPWRDYHLKIVGEGVHDLQEQFIVDWSRASKQTAQQVINKVHYFPQLPKGKSAHEIFPTAGVTLENSFAEQISKAKESIFIGSPYFIPSKKVLGKLLKALDNGVSVTILVPYVADHLFVKQASFKYIEELIEHGAQVYEYMNGFYHAKALLFDNKICYLGTANFDRRSFFINYELNCYIYDKSFIEIVKNVINDDLADSELLTIEVIKKRTLSEKITVHAANIIAPFL